MPDTSTSFDPEAMFRDLERLVSVESPSDDLDALARSADEVAALGTRLFGCDPIRHGVHLQWTFGTPRVLILGHHDTVWPRGTLARWPLTRDGDRATGPGCFDMKAGIVLAMHAVAALDSPEGVTIVWTGDEEIGAPTSQDLIVDTATGLAATLVTEPGVGTAVKVARKGLRTLQLHVTGRASHAGLEPENGINAAVELAHHIVTADAWPRPEGLSMVTTLVGAGSTMNTVPATASATFDLRGWLQSDLDDMVQRLRSLTPVLDGAGLTVEQMTGRGPLEETMSRDLYELARDVARECGQPELGSVRVGGVSDGNFTAAAGVPTLDGLGATGGGAHAEGEWISVSSMGDRAALIHGMLTRLLAQSLAMS